MELIFKMLDIIMKKCELSLRLKALIENLQDRKKIDWKERLFANEGPKDIKEIHEEYKQNQLNREEEAERYY